MNVGVRGIPQGDTANSHIPPTSPYRELAHSSQRLDIRTSPRPLGRIPAWPGRRPLPLEGSTHIDALRRIPGVDAIDGAYSTDRARVAPGLSPSKRGGVPWGDWQTPCCRVETLTIRHRIVSCRLPKQPQLAQQRAHPY